MYQAVNYRIASRSQEKVGNKFTNHHTPPSWKTTWNASMADNFSLRLFRYVTSSDFRLIRYFSSNGWLKWCKTFDERTPTGCDECVRDALTPLEHLLLIPIVLLWDSVGALIVGQSEENTNGCQSFENDLRTSRLMSLFQTFLRCSPKPRPILPWLNNNSLKRWHFSPFPRFRLNIAIFALMYMTHRIVQESFFLLDTDDVQDTDEIRLFLRRKNISRQLFKLTWWRFARQTLNSRRIDK